MGGRGLMNCCWENILLEEVASGDAEGKEEGPELVLVAAEVRGGTRASLDACAEAASGFPPAGVMSFLLLSGARD